MITIRQVRKADAKELSKLTRKSWPKAMFLSRNRVVALVGIVDGRVVGAISIKRDGAHNRRHIGTVEGGKVVATCRRAGVATVLLTKAFDICRQNGVSHLLWWLTEDNWAAVEFCLKYGFVMEGRIKKVAKEDDKWKDRLLMVRYLD